MKLSTNKVLLLVALIMSGGGWLGLYLAQHAYPESNLLGGWGLLFGPIYWLGLLLLAVVFIAFLVRTVVSIKISK